MMPRAELLTNVTKASTSDSELSSMERMLGVRLGALDDACEGLLDPL